VQGRRHPELEQLQRDRRGEPLDELRRRDDDDEPVSRRGDDLLARVGAAATLDEPSVGRDGAGPVDRHVETHKRPEGKNIQAQPAGVLLRSWRGYDVPSGRSPSGKRIEKALDRRPGSEPDDHVVVDVLCGGRTDGLHLLLDRQRQTGCGHGPTKLSIIARRWN
jgi:hypothetical protein